jgi:Dockerin type I domain
MRMLGRTLCGVFVIMLLASALTTPISVSIVGFPMIEEAADSPNPGFQTLSEPPSMDWNKTYGGIDFDMAYSLVKTSDGGYAIAGYTYSYGAGSSDFLLVKTDSSGNMQWNKTYGGTFYEAAYSLVETNDHGYAIAGYTSSKIGGSADFWLVKTDRFGNLIWSQIYGDMIGDEAALSVVQTVDGGYALGGSVYYGSSSSSNFELVKTDSGGNMQWKKQYGGADSEYANSMVQTSDGGYALAGEKCSPGGVGNHDFLLVKVDSNGNLQWNKTYGGTDYEVAYSLVQTSDAGYALAGTTYSSGAGNGDFWLVKTSAVGNALWNKTYGGTNTEEARALLQTVDGGYTLAGYTLSFGAGSSDYWLVTTDNTGNTLWNGTYGGPLDDVAYSLVKTSDGGYAIAGATSSYGVGLYDFWLAKIGRARVLGDLNGDGVVDVKDVYEVALAYGTSLEGPNPPGRTYNPSCDINGDDKVDVKDLYTVCKHYGEVAP